MTCTTKSRYDRPSPRVADVACRAWRPVFHSDLTTNPIVSFQFYSAYQTNTHASTHTISLLSLTHTQTRCLDSLIPCLYVAEYLSPPPPSSSSPPSPTPPLPPSLHLPLLLFLPPLALPLLRVLLRIVSSADLRVVALDRLLVIGQAVIHAVEDVVQ